MQIQTFSPTLSSYRTFSGSLAQAQSAGTPDTFTRSSSHQPAKPSLMKKVGLSALGLGSVGGLIGMGLGSFTGSATAFPLCTVIGLVAGAALGAAAYAIEQKEARQQQQ